ncbi:MAG: hypothetical protein V8R85_08320 [Frisingicoccus sp.]
MGKTLHTLNNVTAVKNYQTDKIVIAVLADDPAESLETRRITNSVLQRRLTALKLIWQLHR